MGLVLGDHTSLLQYINTSYTHTPLFKYIIISYQDKAGQKNNKSTGRMPKHVQYRVLAPNYGITVLCKDTKHHYHIM